VRRVQSKELSTAHIFVQACIILIHWLVSLHDHIHLNMQPFSGVNMNSILLLRFNFFL
jgi:hypothetical protein